MKLSLFLKKLCSNCHLKNWNKETGEFLNCKHIYDVKAPKCVIQMRKYVSKNPCDRKRTKKIEDIDNADNLDGLDHFLYSICETCCDCVHMGSKPSEHRARKRRGTLFKSDRSNCPAHAAADMCKVWPNVKGIGSKLSEIINLPSNLEPVCPQFHELFADIHEQVGWFNQPEVPISRSLVYFSTNSPRLSVVLAETHGRIVST